MQPVWIVKFLAPLSGHTKAPGGLWHNSSCQQNLQGVPVKCRPCSVVFLISYTNQRCCLFLVCVFFFTTQVSKTEEAQTLWRLVEKCKFSLQPLELSETLNKGQGHQNLYKRPRLTGVIVMQNFQSSRVLQKRLLEFAKSKSMAVISLCEYTLLRQHNFSLGLF